MRDDLLYRAERLIERIAELPRDKQDFMLGFIEHLEWNASLRLSESVQQETVQDSGCS